MSEERLQEIKDSVNFQREILKAHNMGTLCVDEEQELIEEIERLNKELEEKEAILGGIQQLEAEIERLKKREQECIDHYLVACKYSSEMESKYITANSIINEFEKFLFGELQTYGGGGLAQEYYNKLQELKGSDKW